VSPNGETQSDAVVRRWLAANLTGCFFARALAGRGSKAIRYLTVEPKLDDEFPRFLSASLDGAAADGVAVVFTLPGLSSESDVVELLEALRTDERWGVTDKNEHDNLCRVRLGWRYPHDESGKPKQACVLGLAPLGTMPVTRRAPYVVLVVWPGGFANRFRPAAARTVASLSDMPADAWPNEAAYSKTEAETKELRADIIATDAGSADGADDRVTFSLGPAARSALFG